MKLGQAFPDQLSESAILCSMPILKSGWLGRAMGVCRRDRLCDLNENLVGVFPGVALVWNEPLHDANRAWLAVALVPDDFPKQAARVFVPAQRKIAPHFRLWVHARQNTAYQLEHQTLIDDDGGVALLSG